MRRILALILLFTPLFVDVSSIAAQVCGGGHRTINIYVRNGLEAKGLKYELFEIMPRSLNDDHPATAKYLRDTFFPRGGNGEGPYWIAEPVSVDKVIGAKFISNYKADRYLAKPGERDSLRENKYAGPIVNGEVRFHTLELYDRPLLLKLYADNYEPAYFISNFFGGCSRMNKLMLDDFFWPE